VQLRHRLSRRALRRLPRHLLTSEEGPACKTEPSGSQREPYSSTTVVPGPVVVPPGVTMVLCTTGVPG